ncbi:hypothetical protein B0J14DRAFT_601254 [Halenospora varia]|nr:hypothetical protein B0J14DRAFT_601254 [Halenospora varia]
MKFGGPRKLSSKAFWVDGSVESSRAYSRTRSLRRSRSSAARLTGLGISTSSTTISSSGQKGKRDEEFVDGNSRKRSRSIESRSIVTDVEITVDAEKREPDTTGHRSIQEAEPDSLAGCESETYGNRIHCCLVGFPSGPATPRIQVSWRAFRGAA